MVPKSNPANTLPYAQEAGAVSGLLAFIGQLASTRANYSDFLPAPLILAQRALASALNFALAAALILNFFLAGFETVLVALGAVLAFAALALAQRNLAAAAMRARPAALMPPFFFGALTATEVILVSAPIMAVSCFSKAAIFSLRLAAWRSC